MDDAVAWTLRHAYCPSLSHWGNTTADACVTGAFLRAFSSATDCATWTAAANSYGEMKLPSSVFASVHTGKYDADDGFRLVSFDPAEGAKGDWRSLTPIVDASK